MAKPRKQTYTMDMYLGKMRDLDIRTDADVQRLANQWNNSMASELVVSVLNGEYVPPIILGQESNSQAWVIDGCQRSTSLMLFRFGNLKISPNIEEPVITYRAKVRDGNGNIKYDGCGDIVFETRTFDLRRKNYDKLPEELKKAFNEYQLETVIHENYNMEQISRLVRRFNYHKPMNVSQRTFTFCDRYARKIRNILKRNFFIEAKYTKNERKNGSLERIILETVMAMFHLDNWKKSSQIGAYLNENASMEQFDMLEDNIARLENIVTDDLYPLFTSRDSFLLFALFHKFTKLNIDDGKFADFLHAFKDGLCDREVDGKIFYEKGKSLKDRTVIMEKLGLLETLMYGYLDIPAVEINTDAADGILKFVRENVSPYVTNEDVIQYGEVLEALMRKSGCNKGMVGADNLLSLIGIVAYSFENDIDLDDWIVDYCGRNDDYFSDQKENYLHMKDDLQQFLKLADEA